jgi:nitrite reductase/ring-hydroxylating ferredoxin subunit
MLQKAARRDQVQPEKIIAVQVADQPVALYDVDGEVLATSDICPHAYCLLSENADIVARDEVECSCHGSRFSIRTGENINPPASDPLKTYRVEVRDEDVFVDVE